MHSVRIARYSALGALILSLALTMTGCGAGHGGVSKAKVVKALNREVDSDPELKSALPAGKRTKYVDCLADVIVKKGNQADVKAWQKGAIKLSDVRPFTGEQRKNKGIAACDKYVS